MFIDNIPFHLRIKFLNVEFIVNKLIDKKKLFEIINASFFFLIKRLRVLVTGGALVKEQ